MLKIAVCGATGRMGVATCRAIEDDAEVELVEVIGSSGDVASVVKAEPDVVVDFTVAEAARVNVAAVGEAGIHAVVGTSGLLSDDIARLKRVFTFSHCLVAPNFAIGAVLMTRFAALAAPFFDCAEVLEYHHNRKVDAPSGTAIHTVNSMTDASDNWAADATEDVHIEGVRGGVSNGGIHVHSIRMKGLLAHQSVLLGGEGETLTIRHDSLSRSSFMPGVLLAVKRVAHLPAGLTVGLEKVLGI